MQSNSTRHLPIIRKTALALLSLCFLQPAVRADEPSGYVLIADSSPVGLARGQTLRLTVPNRNLPAGASDGRKYKMLVAPLILDATGDVIAQSGEITLAPGEFHSFDFKRGNLPLAGEAGTGRVQARAQIRYRFFTIVDRTQLAPPALQIIDDITGKTTASFGGFGNDIIYGRAGDDIHQLGLENELIGIVPEQTLRLNILSLSEKGATSLKTLAVHVTLYDARGDVIAQTTGNGIPEGEFRAFDFNRSALHLPGEPITGRLQVRAVAKGTFTLTFTGQTAGGTFAASWELVDDVTGKTATASSTGVWYLRNSNSPGSP